MVYIRRDTAGNIDGVYDTSREDAQEELSITSPELIQFLTQTNNRDDSLSALNSSDLSLIRVIEDIVETLIEKQVILFTDLPVAAREKLHMRGKIRDQLNNLDNLMSDDPGIL
ncbi:MAG TPA: hypothetical protein ENI26_11735 [Methylophaga aminisulfidivorans]|uniref:Tryptophan synthase subunit beta like protein n=2 Tax=root TaxID=1 RepID=A0A7C1VTA1_9GAMM|nr:hypothetical protein [Methylophaga aminisulfidivorans]